jgi:hypothetical protein
MVWAATTVARLARAGRLAKLMCTAGHRIPILRSQILLSQALSRDVPGLTVHALLRTTVRQPRTAAELASKAPHALQTDTQYPRHSQRVQISIHRSGHHAPTQVVPVHALTMECQDRTVAKHVHEALPAQSQCIQNHRLPSRMFLQEVVPYVQMVVVSLHTTVLRANVAVGHVKEHTR